MNQDEKNLINLLFTDPEINSFCKTNNIKGELILKYLGKFIIQFENNKQSKGCSSTRCQMGSGIHTKLVYEENKVELTSIPCPISQTAYINNLDLRFFPNSDALLNEEIDITPERAKILGLMNKFPSEYEKGKFTKGIYLYGPFGTGKTFLMLKLAKTLSQNGVKVFMAYYPDLVRHLKSSIATGELEKTILSLKYCEILILDDIGAESNTAFIRDEILGPILQFRLQSNFPICMTSNLSFNELRNHFGESRDSVDKLKSDRIIERLRYLMVDIALGDKNYRTDQKYKKTIE